MEQSPDFIPYPLSFHSTDKIHGKPVLGPLPVISEENERCGLATAGVPSTITHHAPRPHLSKVLRLKVLDSLPDLRAEWRVQDGT